MLMNDLFELIEKADLCLKENKSVTKSLCDSISKITANNGYIGIAQINPVVGDLEYNSKKIAKYINFAEKIGLESVIFPELSIMGYPIEDTIDRLGSAGIRSVSACPFSLLFRSAAVYSCSNSDPLRTPRIRIFSPLARM